MKELDLGNSDFKSIIENNNYFVDKSLLIKEVIKAQKQVILLPRPRRFGKTLNLSMLKYFFEINQPENDVKQKQGKYPVIYLSFKDAKENNWELCQELIISEICSCYTKHNYLLEKSLLAENEKSEFLRITNKKASKVEYQLSIKKLSDYLQRFYKQRVVILIDEYDTPIQAGYKKFYDESISFMRNLLSGAFKDNSSLYKGVITGILRISKESIFTGLNNVTVYTVLNVYRNRNKADNSRF